MHVSEVDALPQGGSGWTATAWPGDSLSTDRREGGAQHINHGLTSNPWHMPGVARVAHTGLALRCDKAPAVATLARLRAVPWPAAPSQGGTRGQRTGCQQPVAHGAESTGGPVPSWRR